MVFDITFYYIPMSILWQNGGAEHYAIMQTFNISHKVHIVRHFVFRDVDKITVT